MAHIQTSGQGKLDLGFGNYTCNWGVHIAGLYETEAERDEIILGFLSQGNMDGDLQLYCPTERSEEDFHECHARLCPSCADHTRNTSRFQLFSVKDLYYPQGVFSPWDMDKGLAEFFENSQKNGVRNIRATAEMSWALEAVPGTEHLMAYESRLNYFIPGKPWISVCMYNVTKFSGKTIMQVLQTHPYTINGGVVTENPYYQDPSQWLEKNNPEFLSANMPAE
ncbi:MAG: hypothetical protein GY854_12045 [Deltaproteobacteria bacterium]|nr:hypothetical protein [Deltaproteobacteria bacterium]